MIIDTHGDKTPVKKHFIPEWAEKRGLAQSDIAKALDVDKATVSRWFSGNVPQDKSLESIAALFATDVHGLFRDPADDWLARFFQKRNNDERERAILMLKAAFPELDTPPKTGTDG